MGNYFYVNLKGKNVCKQVFFSASSASKIKIKTIIIK